MIDPIIDISELGVRYGEVEAVRGLSLRVERGASYGLLGPNGAGKSSTLRCLAGLQRADSGRVRVCGLDPWRDAGEVRRRMGLVPQALALYQDLGVQENLRIFGGLHGLRGRRLRERVDWGLELSALQAQRHARVETLSGGMARRLNLACSLLHGPELIVCDEPTAGVDITSRAHIFATLRALHADGATLVYTTHYMEEVEALCREVGIIAAGRLVEAGSLDALLERRDGGDELRVVVRSTRGGEHCVEAVRAALEAAGLTASGIEIESVRVSPRSLEDVVLELTGEGAARECER